MKSYFSSLTTLFSRNNFRYFCILGIVFLISGDITYANETGISQEGADRLVNALNGFIAAAATLLGLITAFITLFTYPGWTNGTLFGLTDYLRDIWVLVSNVVYFIFAFILVTIAFMNIIGKGEGNWELKQALPRFIVGVLIVPFTWFLVQFILSIAAVLTVAVLSLPYDVFRDKLQDDTSDSELLNQEICVDLIINLQSGETAVQGVSLSGDNNNGLSEAIQCRDEGSMVSIMDIVTGEAGGQGVKNSMFGIISVYTYGILRVQELSTIKVGDIRFYQEMIDLILKIFFDLLFIVVYLLLMVALLLALFTRGIKLWIFIMLSPIFGLMYFFGKSKEGFGESGKNYNVKEFISLAMIPVYVSAALAFGFIFILVATEGLKEHVSDGSTLDTLDLGGLKLEVTGSYGDGDLNLGVIGKLIVQIFGVAILWIAVMVALRSSEATKAIVEPIYQFGQSMGKLAAAAPTYAPIIPAGNGERLSVAGLGTFGQSMESTVAANARGTGSRLGTTFGEAFSGGSNPASRLNAETAPHREAVTNGDRTAIDRTLSAMAASTNRETIADRQFRERFIEDLDNILRREDGTEILTADQRRLLVGQNDPDRFSELLARELQNAQLDTHLRQSSRERLQQFLGGGSLSSISSSQIANSFSIDQTTSQTPPAQGPTNQTTNINVTTSTISLPADGSNAARDIGIPTTGGFNNNDDKMRLRAAFSDRDSFIRAITPHISSESRRDELADSIF
ncbi:SLC19 family protein [Candidatus Gracilibacteria bacterium]|nr:SLC19 family protein [Candidatus Gracilibacteria bacterium]